jgi:hypothetical protein
MRKRSHHGAFEKDIIISFVSDFHVGDIQKLIDLFEIR